MLDRNDYNYTILFWCKIMNHRMSLQLYLVRHGETKENLNHILQGHLAGELVNVQLQLIEKHSF